MTTTPETQPTLPSFPEGTSKYEMLGVAADASSHELKVAYRRQALLFHPDRHSEQDRPQAEQLFKEISAAYRILSHPDRRKRYDQALRAGHTYQEGGQPEGMVSLEEILADIQEYESIFSRAQLATLDSALADVVIENLIDRLGEQVVEVYKLQQAPLNAGFPGGFKTGAVVLTNIRVLIPFTYQWEEVSGNVKTVYKGLSVPNAAWPLITKLQIHAARRLSPSVVVSLEQEREATVAFQSGHHNLAELLLIANLWGVPCQLTEEDARAAEFRSALFVPWKITGWSSVATLGAAGVVGWFADAGFLGGSAALLTWASGTGLAQAIVLLTAASTARRLSRWMLAYQSSSLPDAMRKLCGAATAAHGPLATTA